ncbi:TCR/Tet family MFS transporter [Ovoidimarina sediminis]|uniref:TCR/Tet family MFS transporter n=1 Tax=Ovoidimarina sediminis TaxID=3079856 RepID=UPI002909EA71|nr:TCR/Tet family MFS transporter [Rhodophyticola sp. MJ-SS7]MDU8946207.1 TCR/Tet family MFS transporter [Rhodophyticola sp. MJ-SS7]
MREQRLPLTVILLTLMIDAMGIGLIIPVMPALIQEVDGGTLGEAAVWGGILTSVFAVMQFACAPMLGSLSDRFGRRLVLLVSLAVMAADYLVMAVAGTIWLLLAGRIVAGIASATSAVGYAYIADISKPEEKAGRFGLIGAAFGIGFVIGPLIGGALGELGTRAPFYAAAGLAALNFTLGFFVLPETVTGATRRRFQWSRANPFGSFAALNRMPGIGRLILLFFLYQVAFMVYPAVWAYFTEARFGWDPAMIGLSLGSFGIAMAVVQGGLIRLILKRFGDRATVTFGIGFNACAFLALAPVANGTLALILTPLTAIGAVVTPALQGMLSRRVADDAQGELQGVLTSATSLALILSPLAMTWIFFAFTGGGMPVYLPGAPFLLSMLLMGVCAVVFAGQAPAERADRV